MTTFKVPKGCKGCDFADGAKYNASGGKITIDNPKHERMYRKHANYELIGCEPGSLNPGGLPENDCVTCGFNAWPWQTICSRCGSHLPRATKENSE